MTTRQASDDTIDGIARKLTKKLLNGDSESSCSRFIRMQEIEIGDDAHDNLMYAFMRHSKRAGCPESLTYNVAKQIGRLNG